MQSHHVWSFDRGLNAQLSHYSYNVRLTTAGGNESAVTRALVARWWKAFFPNVYTLGKRLLQNVNITRLCIAAIFTSLCTFSTDVSVYVCSYAAVVIIKIDDNGDDNNNFAYDT